MPSSISRGQGAISDMDGSCLLFQQAPFRRPTGVLVVLLIGLAQASTSGIDSPCSIVGGPTGHCHRGARRHLIGHTLAAITGRGADNGLSTGMIENRTEIMLREALSPRRSVDSRGRMAVFEFTIRGDLSQKLDRIKSLAAQKGVAFRGGLGSGTFSGGISFLGMGIRGSYSISGDKITVNVIEKPASYSWERVESELRSFVEG